MRNCGWGKTRDGKRLPRLDVVWLGTASAGTAGPHWCTALIWSEHKHGALCDFQNNLFQHIPRDPCLNMMHLVCYCLFSESGALLHSPMGQSNDFLKTIQSHEGIVLMTLTDDNDNKPVHWLLWFINVAYWTLNIKSETKMKTTSSTSSWMPWKERISLIKHKLSTIECFLSVLRWLICSVRILFFLDGHLLFR